MWVGGGSRHAVFFRLNLGWGPPIPERIGILPSGPPHSGQVRAAVNCQLLGPFETRRVPGLGWLAGSRPCALFWLSFGSNAIQSHSLLFA